MPNLVIGNTSQLAHYFPEDFVKISSRSIDFDLLGRSWDNVYICFAEQRTFLDDPDIFWRTNCSYTAKLIDATNYKRLYFYSTTYLWNAYDGNFNVSTPFKYRFTQYIASKEWITDYVMSLKNTTVLFPCNFNSIHRKEGFLFGKVFDSIKNKKKIELGNTNFLKEMTHPKRVVAESFGTEHKIIHGCFVNVNEVIRELYSRSGLRYEDYVVEVDGETPKDDIRVALDYTQEDLIRDMLDD
jgi:hypothetical protein